MGFENASFDGWTGEVLRRDNNRVTPRLLQHCIVTPNMRDPYIPPANLSVVPLGESYSLRLGNTAAGGHIARIRKTFRVDSSNMLFTYRYAVVLEDPAGSNGHDGLNSPHFQARLITPDGTSISCAEYSVVVSSNLQSYSRICIRADNDDRNNDGLNNSNTEVNNEAVNIGCPNGATGSNTNLTPIITSSNVPTGGATCSGGGGGNNDWMDLYYRSWSTVTVVLDQYLGQQITIEFSAADCEPGGHLGYAYVSAECNRLNLALPGFICSGTETKLVNAPAGFASYTWTTSNGGTIQGARNGQFITITSAGTYQVSVVPFTTAATTCPYEITYLVRNRCPLEKTMCESLKGSGIATGINLNAYNNEVKGNVPTSTVQSWHTGIPASSGNKIANPANAIVTTGKYYAVIIDPTIKDDTVQLGFEIISKPQVNFDNLPVFCQGSPLYGITGATPTGGVFSGPFVTSAGRFNPSTIGTFDIKYKLVNSNGCADSLIKQAVVKTIAAVEALGDTTVCFLGSSITVPLRSKTAPSDSVIWSSPIGTIANKNLAATSIALTGNAPFETQFYVKIQSFNETCPPSKDSILIKTVQGPVVTAGTDTEFCTDGRTETISVNAQASYADNVQWDGIDVAFSPNSTANTTATMSNSSSLPKTFKLRISAIKNLCPTAKDSMLVTLNPPPNLIVPVPPACANSNVKLEANLISGATYFWGTSPGSSQNTFSTNVGSGLNQFKVLVRDSKGCRDSLFLNLIPQAAPIFTLQGQNICPGQWGNIVATLSDPSQANVPGFTFQWKREEVLLSSSQWQNLPYNRAGTYSLELGIVGCKTTNRVSIVEHPTPQIDMPLIYQYCPETDQQIKITSPVFSSNTWFFENGTREVGTSLSVSPPKNTFYGLLVTNQVGCKDSAQILVKKACPPRLFVPNVITPSNSDINSTLQIFGVNYTNFEITIFNRWGEIIFNTKDPKNAWDGVYKLENMPIGTYPWIVTYEGDSEDYKGPYKKVGEVTVVR